MAGPEFRDPSLPQTPQSLEVTVTDLSHSVNSLGARVDNVTEMIGAVKASLDDGRRARNSQEYDVKRALDLANQALSQVEVLEMKWQKAKKKNKARKKLFRELVGGRE